MDDNKLETITELAEVIAIQNEQIRELFRQLDEQAEVIIEYELNDEEEEKVTNAMASEFLEALQDADELDEEAIEPFQEIFDRYFGGSQETE